MSKNNEPLLNHLVSIQSWLRPALTPVLENRDHKRLVDDLETIDRSLKASALEAKAITVALENLPQGVSQKQRNRRAEFALYALQAFAGHRRVHCTVLQQCSVMNSCVN